MNRQQAVIVGLLIAGLALLAAAVAVPVGQIDKHDTRAQSMQSNEEITASYTVLAYEELSDRGREVYRRALENDGTYAVPEGEGASEFTYLTRDELNGMSPEQQRQATQYVIDRRGASSLPPADESDPDARYDLITVGTYDPEFPSEQHVPNLAAAAVGLVCLGVGGYRYVSA
jgi:hypothetical protein